MKRDGGLKRKAPASHRASWLLRVPVAGCMDAIVRCCAIGRSLGVPWSGGWRACSGGLRGKGTEEESEPACCKKYRKIELGFLITYTGDEESCGRGRELIGEWGFEYG